MRNYLKILKINEYSITPKYQQIFNSLLDGVKNNQLEIGDVLPSINDLSFALEVSRNTIERAYRDLKNFGVVSAIPGKGYFICDISFQKPKKILLLFNKLSPHKKLIYDAFSKKLGSSANIDFFIYNNDLNTFKRILSGDLEVYAKMVIIPHFVDEEDDVYSILDELPKDKLILMDKLIEGVSGTFCAVYEDFEKDIFAALVELSERLQHYQVLKIIFPKNSYYSKNILAGFIRFCTQYNFEYEILSSLEFEILVQGTVYINLKEEDLVEIIERIISSEFRIGNEIGVISYNETALKKIILNGITTISTNFVNMGEIAAEMVLGQRSGKVSLPFGVIHRNSL